MHLIADRLTATGLRLAGLRKITIAEKNTVVTAFKKINPSESIILVTKELSQYARKEIDQLRDAGKIVIAIPDRSGSGEEITNELVKNAVGFELRKNG